MASKLASFLVTLNMKHYAGTCTLQALIMLKLTVELKYCYCNAKFFLSFSRFFCSMLFLFFVKTIQKNVNSDLNNTD